MMIENQSIFDILTKDSVWNIEKWALKEVINIKIFKLNIAKI